MLSKKYGMADMVFKKAIKEYTGCSVIASAFFVKWKRKIKEHSHFQQIALPILEEKSKGGNDKNRPN